MRYHQPPIEYPLKKFRLALGLSIRDLAKLVGVNHSHISRIESGQTIASFEIAKRIIEALKEREKQHE